MQTIISYGARRILGRCQKPAAGGPQMPRLNGKKARECKPWLAATALCVGWGGLLADRLRPKIALTFKVLNIKNASHL